MKRYPYILVIATLFCATSIAQQLGEPTLGETARKIRSDKQTADEAAPKPDEPKVLEEPTPVHAAKASAPKPPTQQTPAADANQAATVSSLNPQLMEEDELAYVAKIQELVSDDKFKELDKMADAARTSKARFKGGNWQLFVFYDAVTNPVGEHVSVADWNDLIDRLKVWQRTIPESVTADVALAQTYINLGWQARGDGYADTVGENGWKGLHENVEQAKEALHAANALKDKCPQQYVVAQHVALIEGWDKEKTTALFDEAVAFEPTYYYYYRNQANYLQERWRGDEGEAVQFAIVAASRVKGKQGAYIYFEIATVLNCHCETEEDLPKMSWRLIKEGYAAMDEMYGTSLLKKNRFAYMAYRQNDRGAAQKTLAQVSANWNASVWGARRTFETAQKWAFAEEQAGK